MALYDTADLVDRFKRLAKLGTNVAQIDDSDIYRYLTDGQLYWLGQLQTHVPRLNWDDTWELMTAASDYKTYTFSSEPLGKVEIYESVRAREPMRAGAPWDQSADFFWRGLQTIEIPGGRARQFADGPYARYVARPSDIAVAQDPVLQPLEARLLMVYTGLAQWARETGLVDPTTYEDLADGLWAGKRPGDSGLLGTLKVRFGSDSVGSHGPWYKNPDMSNLPVRTS